MSRFLSGIFVVGTALTGPLAALPEEEGRMVTGEVEEPVELSPETIIPWHDSLAELPEWISQEAAEIDDRIRPANQGAGLFPPEVWPLQPEPTLGPLIWDEALAGRRPPPVRQGTPGPVVIGPELMARYEGQPPGAVLIDPQHLAPGDRVQSLVQRWLNEQCIFHTTVLLFGEGQQLPADFDPQALRSRWFGEDPDALLVFYFNREPERTLAIFGHEARSRYGADLLRSVVDAAVTEAGRVGVDEGQLERFCYKMSVRLHWIARSIPGGGEAHPPVEDRDPADWSGHAAWLAGLVAAGLIAGRVIFRHRRALRGVASGPILLPDLEFQPRLGAPHSGGFCAMITFAKPPVPAVAADG